MTYTVKIANSQDEFDQIFKINYQTFVEEIPQHEANNYGKLIDKFHSNNTYIIVKKESEVVGMLSINTNRPFSLDSKISQLESYLPSHSKLAEVRLLSVIPGSRHTFVFIKLLKAIFQYGIENQIDMAVISGTVRQVKLYHHFGFVDFAKPVGSENAFYQPMYISFNSLSGYLNTLKH